MLSRILRERQETLEQDLATYARAGVARVGLTPSDLDDGGVDAVSSAGIDVTHIGNGSIAPVTGAERIRHSVDLAVEAGARCVYGPAGGDMALEWEGQAAQFVAAIEPVKRYADEQGIPLLIEPTITLYADMSMLHTLEDTVELSDRAGIGVCVDVQHCWTDRRLRESIRRADGKIGLVQLSDWVPGNRHHFRAVPGDGAIPLERIVGWILETGYDGFFDLELSNEPGVDEVETIARALDRAGNLLERVGA
jgi:sugar phosphate isomerase/epimerase